MDAHARRSPPTATLGNRSRAAWEAPGDVAQASLFLASDAGRFITGVALPVDGGVMARIG